jgi:thioredoxin reductase
MKLHTVDVAVIGAGTAGLSAQRAAQRAGKSALLIDRGPLGTTCARVGCMPSKLLIAAGDAAHAIEAAALFGVHAGPPRIDGPAVLQRVQRERDRFVSFVVADCEALLASGALIMGEARLVAPDLLQVGASTQVRFSGLVVATGTTPTIPGAFAALPRELLLTNDSVFELTDLPASVLVVGTGPIGLELGQALQRLGVRVTIVGNRGVVGPLKDEAVKAAALAAFRRELDVQPEYGFEEIAVGGEGVTMRYRSDDGTSKTGTWARVLVAAGRRGGQRVPATRVLPGHVLAAPSRVPRAIALSPTLSPRNGGTRGRLRANPGSSRCFPCPPPSVLTLPEPTPSAPRSCAHGHDPASDHSGRSSRTIDRCAGATIHVRATSGPVARDERGADDVRSGERGADERGSSGRTQGSRADAPSSVRCEDTGLA